MLPETRAAICLIAAEVAPLSKTGGLGDVAGALAKQLSAEGQEVRVFSPAYASIDLAACGARPLAHLARRRLTLGAHAFEYSVLRGTLPGDVPVYLIECPALFGRASLYTSDPDEHLRFIAFTRAALDTCRELRWAPQILHCNDWHTAFAPLFLRTVYRLSGNLLRRPRRRPRARARGPLAPLPG